MKIKTFTFAGCPDIVFGPGRITELGKIASGLGKTALLVIGCSSLEKSGAFNKIVKDLKKNLIKHYYYSIIEEPSPDLIDKAVEMYIDKNIDRVISIGGGSVIDTGKAISAMILSGDSVIDYIPGVGKGKTHNGEKIPFIAVPTTSGTGSEATKNAVLSNIGVEGFKKSIKHDNFVPDIALIDPELVKTCPSDVSAACGMDALTQLLGGYLSTNASPMTDYLALSGMEYIKDNLVAACTTGFDNTDVRAGMAYASLMSGIVLANAGLGIVHGFASSIGGFFNIPHGVVCGTLLAPAVEMNIKKLKGNKEAGKIALEKYAKASALLFRKDEKNQDKNCDQLIKTLYEWTEKLDIPTLNKYGIAENDIDKILAKTKNRNNPVELANEDIRDILYKRIK